MFDLIMIIILFSQKLYEEMDDRINAAMKEGKLPQNIHEQHKGFAEWETGITAKDHQAIVQVN